MRPLRLRLHGFTRFSTPVDLDLEGLPPGLIAVVGPNGAGKTTLFESLGPMPLFLEFPSYPGSLRDVAIARNASLDLEVSHGGARYRLVVQVDPEAGGGAGKTEAYLYVHDGGGWASLAGPGVRAYAEAVARVFPPRELFLASVYAAQTGAGNFFDLRPAERKDLFAQLLGLEHLQQLAARATAHRRPLDAILSRLDEEASVIAADITVVAELRAEQDRQRAVVGPLELEQQRQQQLADAAHDTAVRGRAALARLQEQRDQALARRASVVREIDRLTTAAATAHATIVWAQSVLDDGPRRRARAAELAGAEAVRDSAAERWRSSRVEVQALQQRTADQQAALGRLTTQIEALRSRAAALQAARDELPTVEAKLRNLRLDREKRADSAAALLTAQQQHRARAGAWTARAGQATSGLDRASARLEAARRAAALVDEVPCRGERVIFPDLDDGRGSWKVGDPMPVPLSADCGTCRFLADGRAAIEELPALEQALRVAEAQRTLVVAEQADLEAEDARLAACAEAIVVFDRRIADLAPAESRHSYLRATIDGAADIDQTIAGVVQEIDGLNIAAPSLAAQFADAQARQHAIEQEGQTAAARVGALADAAAHVAELDRAAGALDGSVREHAATTGRRADLEAELRELVIPPEPQEALEVVLGAEGADRAAAVALQMARDAVDAARQALARLTGRQEALGDPAARLEALQARRTRAALRRAGLVLLERALGREGIQALEIDAAGPEVSRLCNQLLEGCYGPRFQVALVTIQEAGRGRVQREVFDLLVHDGERAGEPRAQSRHSGGEKVIIDEALKLALAVFNSARAGTSETLWRDEADGDLDEQNAARYPGMLRRALALGGFRNLLFVTHREAVWSQADALIRVADGRVTTEIL